MPGFDVEAASDGADNRAYDSETPSVSTKVSSDDVKITADADKKRNGSIHSDDGDKRLAGSIHSDDGDKKLAGSSHSDDGDKKRNGSNHSDDGDKKLDGSSHSDYESDDLPPAYPGMGRELLLKHCNTPFWRRLRTSLLLIFWITWVALLIAVVYLTITHPRCKIPPAKTWWQKASIYEVDPRTLPEVDGLRGLKGVTMRLDDFEALRIDTIYIRNPYPGGPGSPTNQRIIDPTIGTLADLDELVNAAHNKSLKVVLEFVAGHTSSSHDWVANRPNFYIREACTGGNTPNNWLDTNGGSAWTDMSGQCYLHQYGVDKLALNLRNNLVLSQIDVSMRVWLDRGIDGFVMSDVSRLVVDYNLADEPASGQSVGSSDYQFLDHIWTHHLQENSALLNRWRGIIEEYSEEDHPRLLAVNVDGLNATNEDMYNGETANGGAMLVFNQRPLRDCSVSKTGLPAHGFNLSADPLAITTQLRDLLSQGPVLLCSGNEFGHLNESSYLDAALSGDFSNIDTKHFETYKMAAALRTNKTFILGDQQKVDDISSGTAFTRSLQGQNTYLVVLNDGPNQDPISLANVAIGESAIVELYSGHSDALEPESSVTSGDDITVEYGEGIVLSWPYVIG